jgi:hypothetical protein
LFWWRRLQVAPLSIKIAVWALIVQGAGAFLYGAAALATGTDPLGATAILGFSLYAIVALSRSSRWPLAILVVAYGAGYAAWAVAGYGSIALVSHGLAEAFVLGLLVLPHWRRLSWLPFGDEPPEDPRPEDLFD